MNQKPLVSIITVCLNSAATIRQTIESVLFQSYSNIEYILVDGQSNDGTLQIIEEYALRFAASQIRYRWISEVDAGIYDAMNKGIRMATGEWIGIINSDDWYEEDALSKMFHEAHADPVDVIYGLVKIVGATVQSIEQRMFDSDDKMSSMRHQGVFVRRSLHDEIGLYCTDYKVAADYDFLLKCQAQGKVSRFVLCVVASFRTAGVSNNQRNRESAIYEMYKVWYMNGLVSRKRFVYQTCVKRRLRRLCSTVKRLLGMRS